MGILSFLKGVIKPITDLVDNVHTSEEEKGKLKVALAHMEFAIAEKTLGLQTQLIQARSEIVGAEIKGESWLQRNWRPLLMVTFILIIAYNHLVVPIFSAPPATIPDDMWDLLKLGITGYIVSRGAEKGIRTYVNGKTITPNEGT